MHTVTSKLQDEGIDSMSMIHDSFGVHTSHVNRLKEIVDSGFKEIHSPNPFNCLIESLGMSDEYKIEGDFLDELLEGEMIS